MRLYQALATAIIALQNSQRSNVETWIVRWQERIDEMLTRFPSGAGFNKGTNICLDMCSDKVLVFSTAFQHMDENGLYDGWTDHLVKIYATFNGVDIKITGKNKNEIKDYIADMFHEVLMEEYPTETLWALHKNG